MLATALALATSVGAQTPTPAAKSPTAAPMMGHHMDSAAKPKVTADMKAECEAMMAKKLEMKDKLEAMDGSLDKLVAEMNAAKGSKDVDALERPMAAVLNELVAQRKTSRAMKAEMEAAMMPHMMRHMQMHGTSTKGTMECPMMKAQADEKKPAM